MKVWKPAKSLVTGKISYIQKDVSPLIDIFNDWDWWKSFSMKYHDQILDWMLKNREILPDEIKKQIPKCRVHCIYEHDSRHHGPVNWLHLKKV